MVLVLNQTMLAGFPMFPGEAVALSGAGATVTGVHPSELDFSG